jgi:hypothetical protein
LRSRLKKQERPVPAIIYKHAPSLSQLEEELQRARELESAGKERLDAHEKRVADFKTARRVTSHSLNLLDTMRETQRLQGGHVLLLEREVRECSEKKPTQKYPAPNVADQYRQKADECADTAARVRDADVAITYRDLSFQWRELAGMTERVERDKSKARW